MAPEAVVVDERAGTGSPLRWPLVVSGVIWILISLLVLSFDSTSAATIGYMVAFVLILAGVSEFVTSTLAPGWTWLHIVLGVLFIIGGIGSLLDPFQAFGILALFVGWYLLIKGVFDIFMAIGLRRELPLWGLTLAVGIAQMLLGIWALGYPGRSAWLLVLWVGLGALFRGIGDIIAAFLNGGDRV